MTASPVTRGTARRLSPWLVAGVIIYGSLYPFRIVFPPSPDDWRNLLSLAPPAIHFGDILANVLLFLPLGFLLGVYAPTRKRGLVTAAAAGLGVGLGVQILQVVIEGRIPSLWDGLWNLVGTLAGTVAAMAVAKAPAGSQQPSIWPRPGASYPELLLILWLATGTFPFVPSLDWHAFKDALKPLLLHPEIAPLDLLGAMVGWGAFAHLWASRTRLPLPLLGPITALVGVYTAQILIVNRAPDPSDLLGGGLGLLLAGLPLAARVRAGLLLVLLMIWLGATALTPWDPALVPGSFQWLPMVGFLEGNLRLNLWVGLEKLFFYGLLVELLAGIGLRAGAPLIGAGFLGVLEWVQRWLPATHTAEITDPLLLLAMALARYGSEGLAEGTQQGPRVATRGP
ncbi:VanZ family protein [Thiohalorhabdus sp.]|uniref:VanZ family protein n=1 Tax=Thiohalorhabdus sp. TaxID=3094134 RepID=UPI002FC2A0D2